MEAGKSEAKRIRGVDYGFQHGNQVGNQAQPGNQKAQKHGLNPLRKAVYTLGNRVIDKRTSVGRALAEWREALIRDLGGDISTQQDCIVWLAVKTKLLLDSVDVWLLQQDTLIVSKRNSIIPAVNQRQQLADALARYMTMLGLQRKTKLASLSEILAQPDDKPDNGTGAKDNESRTDSNGTAEKGETE
jgi:hypothetical protein